MATEYWAVDYFQLNAAQDAKGESAIVLLVLKDIEVVKPIGTVKSAVLIDAGNGLETAELIKKAITNIECSYAGYKVDPLAPVRFKFDAVVLTHWDEVCRYTLLGIIVHKSTDMNRITIGAPPCRIACLKIDHK